MPIKLFKSTFFSLVFNLVTLNFLDVNISLNGPKFGCQKELLQKYQTSGFSYFAIYLKSQHLGANAKNKHSYCRNNASKQFNLGSSDFY